MVDNGAKHFTRLTLQCTHNSFELRGDLQDETIMLNELDYVCFMQCIMQSVELALQKQELENEAF